MGRSRDLADGSYIADGSITQADLASGVAGTGPAFSAYSSANQFPSSGTYTKVIFGTEVFDTNNCFSSSTFTPNVAGYYQVSASISMAADTGMTAGFILFYKNGASTLANIGSHVTGLSTVGYYVMSASGLVYMNGSTDYLEVYGAILGTGTNRYFFLSQPTYPTVFTGALVRAA